MADIRLRPRSASEIVDAAFQLYRRAPMQYVVVTAIGYAPGLVLQFMLTSATSAADPADFSALFGGRGAALMALAWVGYTLMSAMTLTLASEMYHGRAVDLAAVVRGVLPRVPALLGASLGRAVLMFVGMLSLVVPGIYVFARYFVVHAVVLLEGRGVAAAFGRSTELTRDRKMHVLGTYVLAMVLYMVGSFAVGIVGAITQSQVIATLLGGVYTFVAYPVVGITEALLYYDARIRGEGYDIEVMTGALGAEGA